MGEQGKKWALLIGVDRYHESLGSLKYASADCRALREVLTSGPLGFEAERVCLLTDDGDERHRPTYANIHNALGTWLVLPGEEDLVLVYFAGHGLALKEEAYLVPGDATLTAVHTLGVRLGYVQEVLERCRARRKVLVVDACHSGAGRDVSTMTKTMLEGLGAGEGLYTVSSCGLDERSYEWEEKGRGVFSYFLTEALRGGCKCDAQGRLTADGVYEWVHDEVVKWAAPKGYVQRPQRFAKGAGVIVLAQRELEYAALAEQYRRELEAMKARLTEMELREKQQRLQEEERTRRRERVMEELTKCLAQYPKLKGAALIAAVRKRLGKEAEGLSGEELNQWVQEATLGSAICSPDGAEKRRVRAEPCKLPEWAQWAKQHEVSDRLWLAAALGSNVGAVIAVILSAWLADSGVLLGALIGLLIAATLSGIVGVVVSVGLTNARIGFAIWSFSMSLGMALGGGTSAEADRPFFGVILAEAAVGALIFSNASLPRYRNQYRKECAELCVESGDYVQAADFAFRLTSWGVDEVTTTAVVLAIAQQAEANGDLELARRVYKRASKYWKSLRATRELERLGLP